MLVRCVAYNSGYMLAPQRHGSAIDAALPRQSYEWCRLPLFRLRIPNPQAHFPKRTHTTKNSCTVEERKPWTSQKDSFWKARFVPLWTGPCDAAAALFETD
ncbi:hypothetical protein TraAM80_01316 [Trypanosoma rangeli]|uniref:Uncharacterized protein n=1 Tax=Trypanosoma rangeli TaxID=5698 RepID=A0A422NZ90_TRYRA|nr:uncharacterized protein TraAM80_01316 [Trypanosoma rangeli]RNF10755.1 hypothetical protein TraAM80_01316 [Trypanosoma rangeli]|eukprot:RNF10755.1 hypothetical protein TraAM80_01316 [Trypanosoma rangeli]